VAALEKTVLTDNLRPKATVLARLDAIEQRLKDRDKADEKEAKSDEGALGDLRKAVDKGQKQNEDLLRRMKALEEKQGGGEAKADDVQALRRDVDRTTKVLDELKERIRKLETKK
jgi:chromosome segregation ATPase